jgi:hypothetical protein
MRNFIIFFDEKTGTSPLVQLLDEFGLISVVRIGKNTGFEPFDTHHCGRMKLDDLKQCLDLIYNQAPIDTEELNRLYVKTAKRPLAVIDGKGIVGFKMRFRPPRAYPFHVDHLPVWNKLLGKIFRKRYMRPFRIVMFDLLKRHNVVVLMAIRQDVLRLGLSKYHGDGTGKPGHLQFKVARGAINRDDLKKIHVDCERLEKIIADCEVNHAEKRLLMEEFKQAGIPAYPILYEDFVADKRSYLENLFEILDLDITDDEISQVLSEEEYLKKVHSDDISEFVENHEEVMNRFSDRFVSWR